MCENHVCTFVFICKNNKKEKEKKVAIQIIGEDSSNMLIVSNTGSVNLIEK